MMNSNPVGWFEIYVKDMAQAKKFYAGMLGVNLQDIDAPTREISEMCTFPGTPNGVGATGALIRMEGMGGGANGTIIYFSCEDCSVEAGRAEPNGGKLMKPKLSVGKHGFVAIVADPDGNVVGLHSLK